MNSVTEVTNSTLRPTSVKKDVPLVNTSILESTVAENVQTTLLSVRMLTQLLYVELDSV